MKKFRVVFAMDKIITDSFTAQVITKMLMCIFPESDRHCSDLARMYYGSNMGLLYLSDTNRELSINELIIAVNSYMFDRYYECHYTAKIKEFYGSIGVEINKKTPEFSSKDNSITIRKSSGEKTCIDNKNRKRRSKIDFEKYCRLYRDFVEGNEWYYYPELFLLATNMVNIEQGKSMFLKTLASHKNEHCTSYHTRDWKPILNTIIDMGYRPMSCDRCPYGNECTHYKNMICTVNPGYCGIRPVEKKEYCGIDEAEESLRQNIYNTIYSDIDGIDIIKAATGLGKTHTYLELISNSDERFLVVVPTHKLIQEIKIKAEKMGIVFFTMPELKGFSKELT